MSIVVELLENSQSSEELMCSVSHALFRDKSLDLGQGVFELFGAIVRRHCNSIHINQSIIFYFHLKNQARYSAITYSYRDSGLPEKQVLIKLAAHYHIYVHC